MRTRCAIMALRVTPPAEDKGVEVEGVEEARGVTISVCGHLGHSWATLRQTIAASMAHITEKCVDSG